MLQQHVSPQQLVSALEFMARRGPDGTFVNNKNTLDGYQLMFLHNLLHICGEKTIQPIVQDNCICMFNGEIYNYKDLGAYKSDTECIIPLYKEHGAKFLQQLDGEFAICLYDFANGLLMYSSDVFMTKPLYIGYTQDRAEIGIASYASTLQKLGFSNVNMAKPNNCIVLKWFGDLKTWVLKEEFQLFSFDIRQYKTDLVSWNNALENSIRKRTTHGNYKVFIPLSSGYDSGVICAALNKLQLPYDTFSIGHGENANVLEQRMILNRKDGSCDICAYVTRVPQEEKSLLKKSFIDTVEPFKYIHYDSGDQRMDMHSDEGANSMLYICQKQSSRGYKIILSGSGADEIYSDYGFQGRKIYHHSQFGGLWPQDLSTLFPWKKFYDDTQRSYLFKDEFVGGSCGLECRYPFLDKYLVQEWLWLVPELKNKSYKHCLEQYLEMCGYPMENGAKRGFQF